MIKFAQNIIKKRDLGITPSTNKKYSTNVLPTFKIEGRIPSQKRLNQDKFSITLLSDVFCPIPTLTTLQSEKIQKNSIRRNKWY